MDPLIKTDAFTRQRQSMVDEQLRARGIHDQRVLTAMACVPRHEFVAEEYWNQAYEDHPLPIGEEQTISQPYIVAIMLQALELSGTETVLEVGTGSGYQAAVLAELSRQVYTIERHPSLARSAEAVLQRLGYSNVAVQVGDGSQGFREHAPYDAIVVSAAAPRIPPSLFEQLREGGRMAIPVGPAYAQEFQLVGKESGEMAIRKLEGCRFVPLIGCQGYPEGG
ncbi:MAG TPA: protein-L-isoaspartate(D-aspartate) O-methyltransferase [Terriglobales bacterium]|nr:protein-L-isoaspartate(D-aspartate) O-methyltransferase [Terriglobales bacterium]